MTNSTQDARPPLDSHEDLARMVDYAALAPNHSEEQVSKACDLARKYRVGRLTVRPADLDLVAQWMQGSGVAIATVVSYPHGADTTSAKLFAVRDTLQRGATAIETVLNPGKVISRQFRYIESELLQMAQECHRAGAVLIVDFEMGWLPEDLRVIACRIARRADVDWVRAGSLFGPGQYTNADLAFLAAKLGETVKVDAGPAIRTVEEVLSAYQSGVLGFQTDNPGPLLESWVAELKRRSEADPSASSPSRTVSE